MVVRQAGLAADWAVPRSVAVVSAMLTAGLGAPVVAVYLTAGTAAAMGVAMGLVASLLPATRLPARSALLLGVPVAMTAVVAVALHGQPVAAACFAALTCLLVAPATMLDNGLLAGLPTIAVVYLTVPLVGADRQDLGEVGLWVLAGGALAVLVMSRLRRPVAPDRVPPRAAATHAVVMALAVGVAVLLVLELDVPHGYWVATTLTLVLRPFGAQTRRRTRQRVVGTLAGGLVALGLALVLPSGEALLAAGPLLVLVIAYVVLDRYAPMVTVLTPVVVLLGAAGSGAAASGLAAERVAATVVGAVVAGGLAFALVRAEEPRRADRRPGRRRP